MRIANSLFIILLLVPLGNAQAADAERRQLQQRRQAVEARFKADSQACRQRFFVNTCLDQIRSERLAALKPLQERELELDAADRKARSEEQALRVAERQREFAAEEGRRRTEIVRQQYLSPPDGGGKQASSAASRTRPIDPQAHARDITRQSEEAAQAAARTREQAGKRQRLVLQHQQDFQRRQDERAASTRKPAQPLPIPSAADIAAAASAAAKR